MSIEIYPIRLPVCWPSPHLGTPMVLVQPDLNNLQPTNEGYRYVSNQACHKQIGILRSALQLSQQAVDNFDHSFFVVLPEYSLPAGMFTECEQATKELLPTNTVCIAGFDAISPDQWRTLITDMTTYNGRDLQKSEKSKDYQWVNTAAVWVKDENGKLYRYLQPKLRPAYDEEIATGMYQGAQVFYFEAGPRSFALLICFDLMANLAPGITVARKVFEWFFSEEESGRRPLTLWVIQNNPKPEHPEMVGAAASLLTSIINLNTIIIVNGAGRSGLSSFYFRKRDWEPTNPNTKITKIPSVYRRVNMQELSLTNVSFRTRKPAIHTLIYRNPCDMPLNLGSPRELFSHPRLYRLNGNEAVMETRVEVCQHEITEALERIKPTYCQDPMLLTDKHDIKQRLSSAYEQIKETISDLEVYRLRTILTILFQGDKGIPNPDYWDEGQKGAVRRLIQVLYILLAGDISINIYGETLPEYVTARCDTFTLSVIRGDSRFPPEHFFEVLQEPIYTGSNNHVLLLLEHSDLLPDQRPFPIQTFNVSQVGEYSDLEFGPKPGEEKIFVTRLYCYDRNWLLHHLRISTTLDDFILRLREVFSWQAA